MLYKEVKLGEEGRLGGRLRVRTCCGVVAGVVMVEGEHEEGAKGGRAGGGGG